MLGNIDTIIFDKTGTLTYGNPRVVEMRRTAKCALTHAEIARILLAVESRSEHPIGHAVAKYAAEVLEKEGVCMGGRARVCVRVCCVCVCVGGGGGGG